MTKIETGLVKNIEDAKLAVIRHIALSMIKAEKTSNVRVKIKRLMAGWDNHYFTSCHRNNLRAIAQLQPSTPAEEFDTMIDLLAA